ncbi:MAG: ComF family protein [Parcubacteria group bacterium]|nr:ComF family protein [Parcubacteria group bacterium]
MQKLKELMNVLLDVVLPRRERRIRTEGRKLEDIPLTPVSHDLLGVRITTLMDYQNSTVQDLIRSLKYDGSTRAASLAASALADYLREEMASSRIFSARKTLIVPVPLHKNRVHERGWNQIELVLKALPGEFRNGSLSTHVPHALVRMRDTKPQTRLRRSERLANVAGAFAVVDASSVESAHVFLIDDVTTTGATLANAATPLRRTGATVTLLALARA